MDYVEKRFLTRLSKRTRIAIFADMGITQYIESLLYRYQCVVVPSFGAFLTQNKPAYLQKESNSFFPPSRELSFNAQLQTNDGLLVAHIAQSEKKSYEEVLKEVEELAKSWLLKLRHDGKLDLSPLGEFRLNPEGNIRFKPADRNNYLTSSFGLNSVLATPITREVLKQDVEALEERIPFSITPEHRTQGGIRPYFKYAAVILLALATGLSGYTWYRQQTEAEGLVRAEAQKQVSRHIQEATIFGAQPLELPSITLEIGLTAKKNDGIHHIIAGAFRIRENADKKIRQLRQQGFDAHYVGQNPFGLHQVAYASFTDPREALDSLHAIKRTVSADAWLLSKR